MKVHAYVAANIFLLIFLFLFSGCQKEQIQIKQHDDDYRGHELPVSKGAEGIGLSFYSENKTIEKERTFTLKEDFFKKTLVLENKTSEDLEFILLLFDNGKQVQFKIDGTSMDSYIFHTKSGNITPIHIEKGIDDGFHSLSYLIIKNPNKKYETIEEAFNDSQIYSVRVNILKNISKIPSNNTPIFQAKNEDFEVQGTVSGVLIGKNKEKYKPILSKNLGGFDYQLVFGNQWDKEVDFYVVTLLNWKQIKIDSKHLYVYDKLKSGEEKSITSSIQKNQLKEGRNVLVSLFLPSPYKNLNKNTPFVDAEFMSSNRVIIE
ncbi:hypothetical protein ACFVR2_22885 [Gottfriedia sp. NPDC057991]|uniref:hypothetical protein n=1 Tax=Gottfriedia sp. NPDC057991 TaxID=3346298 RepID=UPI0036DE6670